MAEEQGGLRQVLVRRNGFALVSLEINSAHESRDSPGASQANDRWSSEIAR